MFWLYALLLHTPVAPASYRAAAAAAAVDVAGAMVDRDVDFDSTFHRLRHAYSATVDHDPALHVRRSRRLSKTADRLALVVKVGRRHADGWRCRRRLPACTAVDR